MQHVLRARDAIKHQHGASIYHYNNSCNGTVELSSLYHQQSSFMIMNRDDDRDSSVVPIIANRVMESDTTVAVGITTEQRFDEVKRLYENGYITEAEYQTKRQSILSSL